jgi:hypothetical protein
VLPTTEKAAQRFAVCWNGMVYPLVSVGGKADLKADITALLKTEDSTHKARPDQALVLFPEWPSEGESVSEKTILPLKACLLLRLGEGELAARLWRAWPPPDADDAEKRDVYVELSDALKWAMFDRAVCAQMRGDDRLGLLSAQAAVKLNKSVEEERRREPNAHSYLDVLPALIEDEQRRVKATPRIDAVEKGQRAFADKAAWAAALVADLDQVAARQIMVPGPVDLAANEVVQALIGCGDDAVEPLLQCLEHDQRLTRSWHVGGLHQQDYPYRAPIGVSEAAREALSGILQTSLFSTWSTHDELTAHGAAGRKAAAERMRAYWKKYKGLPLDERWFRMLGDESAGAEQWLQAMADITRPVNVTVSPSGMTIVNQPQPGEKPGLTGEKLRSKRNPSVLDLVAKRIEELDRPEADSSLRLQRLAAASDLALKLPEWDAVGAVPILKGQLEHVVGLYSGGAAADQANMGRVAAMAQALAHGGDHSGLKVYGEWIRTKVSPRTICWPDAEYVLSPLWKFQDDPAMIDAAQRMFNGPPCDWNPMPPHMIAGWSGHEDLLHSPLLGLKSFRELVLRGLADQTPYATLTIRGRHEGEFKWDWGGSSGTDIPSGETHVAPVGTVLTLRTCDRYARQVSLVAGAPAIEDYWPQADRDQAVKACDEFLRRYGERLRYNERFPFDDVFPRWEQACHLTFPLLDHPASAKEAGSQQAVFSLEGQGERRVVRPLALPAKAKCVTLRTHPWEQGYDDEAKGESAVRQAFLQDCQVWQAEEVKINGQWQRYYGVVGPHEVEKVAAADIEFPAGWPWASLSGGVDCRLDNTRPGLVVRLSIRNRSGAPQYLPAQFAVKSDDGKLAIRPGMSVTLVRLHEREENGLQGPRDSGTPVTIKTLSRLNSVLAGQQRLVESSESYEACKFDVRDCFDLTQPGQYRLQIHFSKQSGLGEGPSAPIDLDL